MRHRLLGSPKRCAVLDECARTPGDVPRLAGLRPEPDRVRRSGPTLKRPQSTWRHVSRCPTSGSWTGLIPCPRGPATGPGPLRAAPPSARRPGPRPSTFAPARPANPAPALRLNDEATAASPSTRARCPRCPALTPKSLATPPARHRRRARDPFPQRAGPHIAHPSGAPPIASRPLTIAFSPGTIRRHSPSGNAIPSRKLSPPRAAPHITHRPAGTHRPGTPPNAIGRRGEEPVGPPVPRLWARTSAGSRPDHREPGRRPARPSPGGGTKPPRRHIPRIHESHPARSRGRFRRLVRGTRSSPRPWLGGGPRKRSPTGSGAHPGRRRLVDREPSKRPQHLHDQISGPEGSRCRSGAGGRVRRSIPGPEPTRRRDPPRRRSLARPTPPQPTGSAGLPHPTPRANETSHRDSSLASTSSSPRRSVPARPASRGRHHDPGS